MENTYGKLIKNKLEYFVPYKGGLLLNGMIIVNPSQEQFKEAGYYPIVEVDEVGVDYIENDEYIVHYIGKKRTLIEAKENKINEITAYDISDEVNSFTYQGSPMWIGRDDRISLQNSTNIAIKQGKETIIYWFNNMPFELPCALFLQMLDAVEMYALECFNVTAQHKAEVMNLRNITQVDNYDITKGYPEKLNF